MEQETKKQYSKPELKVHGSVEQMTLTNGHVTPKDVPHGHIQSAFPS
ncbi:MAG: hypothetical protein ACLQVD_01445 [Capsulimonadaceae bacterium]